ncbi:MAG: DUF2238 domain-containing protein [Patescibacteria group bacterium]
MNVEKILFAVFTGLWFVLWYITPNGFNWYLENIVIFLALPFVVFSYFTFRLSNFSYVLIFILAVLHVFGAYNTYAASPWGDWLKVILNLDRNYYDRIIHFIYGVTMAPVAFEIFGKYIKTKNLLLMAVVFSAIVSIGALYEVGEYVAAQIVDPQAGLNFLGFQGDIWDTQKDMALQALGALMGLFLIFVFRARGTK